MVSPKKVYCCDTGIRTFYTGERDWGALFENYCYLRLKHLNLGFIFQDSTELDFFSENKWLLECKFHDEALNTKPQALFDSFPAKEKFVLRNWQDVAAILA